MKHLIYLAAGSARRFGSNKLLAPYRGRPLFAWGLSALEEAAAGRADCRIWVVSRWPEILRQARALGCGAVNSPESEKGLAHTIRAALENLPPAQGDYYLFAVADQPGMRGETVARLLKAADRGVLAASLWLEDHPGSPTLFSAALRDQLLALEGEEGGRKVLEGCGSQCLRIPAGRAGELWDVDRPQDLEKMEEFSP